MGFGSEIFIDTDPKLLAEMIVIGVSGFIIFVLFLLDFVYAFAINYNI